MKRTKTSLFKRITSVFLTLVLLLGLLPVAAPHAHAAETDEYTYTLQFNTKYCGEANNEGHLDITKNDDNHAKGKKLTVIATVTDSTGTEVDSDAWVGVLRGAYTLDSDFSEAEVLYSYTVKGKTSGGTAHNGGKIPIGNKSIPFYADEYSLVLFKDGTLDAPARVITFDITWDNIEETITTQPTCTTDGVKHQVYVGAYSDKNESKQWEYDVTIPALGHDVTFAEVANTDTHSGTCGREGCGETVTEACTFENHVCTVCGGNEELYTDKTVYKYGEPILVTVNQYGDAWDWVGIYKKGETYDPAAGGSASIYWYYVYDPGMSTSGVNILATRDENGRSGEFVAGEYTIVFFPYGGYTPGATVDITVTTEIDESKTVTVSATCEGEGSKTYYNTDGTVANVETISPLGHDYDSKQPEFDAENLQHTLICANDETHTVTENCTWDEGVVVEEPQGDKLGKKEFTCTVCGGTRYESYNGKEVVSEEITVPATCENPGTKVVTYSDGTTEEVEIPKLNHNYPATWTYNDDKATHSHACANDASHVETGDCSFETSAVSGGTRYTCSVCGGSYDVIIMSTNKTEYALGEPIMVTVDASVYEETSTDWVGIWENDWNHNNGVSIYYYYPSAQGWTDFNIYNSAYHQRDSVGVGEYTIRLYAADSYTEITNVKITVGPAVRDESKTVRVEPTCETDGSITYYLTDGTVDEVITAEQDATLKAFGHAYPDTWTPVEGVENHSRACANDETHVETAACVWDEGVETVAPTESTKGEMTYTCTVCGNTRTEEIPVLSATETGREVIAPTCDEQGYTLITYSDGSTRKVDFVTALGHDFGGAYTRVEGTHTHSQTCQRKDCDEVEITECELETNGVLNGSTMSFACTKCGEWEENVILTDKEVYASGEDIIVTINPAYQGLGAKDWIGLYHEGEVPTQGGLTSIRWNYAGDFADGMSIFNSSNHDRPEEDPDNFLKSGKYTLFLCRNDGYEIAARTTITVVTEEDPSKTVLVEPTCTEDGTMTYYNTDGTVSRVVTAAEDATLKAHGHTYGTWTYDGIEKQTHSHVCACTACVEPCGYVETESCQWDEGVVSKEPSETEEGIKTYTCSVCNGTKEEVLPKTSVTVIGTKTVEATCEEAGYVRTYYSDDTYSDEVIPAKGHAYSDTWVYDAETKQHKKVCANDASHVIAETCSFEKLVVDSSVNYTCSVCEGGYVTGLLETDKTVYGVTDPIMVTAHTTFSGAWVGLYKEGEQYDPNSGGVASLFWTYVTADMVGKPFDITAVTGEGGNSGHRGERLSNGKYVLVFFGDSGYTDIVSKVEIEIFTDMSDAEFELRFYKDLPRENGWHTRFELKNVDNPAGGEKVTVCGAVLSGEAGSSWLGVFAGDYDLETDFTGMTPLFSKYISDFNNTKVSLNWPAKGGFEFYVGDFTVVIFADASTNYPVKYITFEVYRPIVEGSEIILREPTCEAPGLKMLDYEDDGKDETQDEGVIVEIPALGHDYGEWTCVEGTNTHSRTCSRENCGAEVKDCVFENGTCTVCGGIEYHIHALTKVTAKPASCTEAGNTEYYTCQCGKWFKDAAAKQEITDKNSVVIPAGHKLTKVTAKTATCTEEGNTEYYTCQCGKWFKDAAAAQEITDKNSVVIAASDHSYGSWVFDAATKKHTRTCANNAAHTETAACSFGEAVVVQQAVGNIKGVKQYTCSVCGGSYTEEFAAEAAGTIDRIYGADRYQTSIAAADQLKENLGIEKFQTVVVASGNDFADALSGTYLADKKDAPILLVRQQSMDSIKAYIKSNLVAGGTVYILGGTKAVPASMESGLDGFNVKRLGGNDRYETNLLILKEAGVSRGEDILVCTGKNFADTLSASATGKAILLVKDQLYSTQKDFLRSVRGGKVYIIGGKTAINEKLAGELAAYGSVQRIDGATRYETSINVAKTFFSQTSCAVLAYGNNFPDGLCGGVLASSMNAPLILVTNDKYSVAAQYAKENHLSHGVVLGGPGLISNAVAEKILNNK